MANGKMLSNFYKYMMWVGKNHMWKARMSADIRKTAVEPMCFLDDR